MAGPHGHESSPPHQRPGQCHGPPHSPPKHGHDGPRHPHSPPRHGHGDGHGPPHPHSPPKHGYGEHGHCKPKPSDGGSIPAVDPESVDLSGLVGLTPEQATKIIQQKLPGAVVDVIVVGDIRPAVPNTVRLWLDPSGKVQLVEIPESDAAATSGGGKPMPVDDNQTTANGPYPEVIGLSPTEASAIVKQKAPAGAIIDVVPGGETRPTLAAVRNTVRLWLDHAGKVRLVETPKVTAA